MAKKSEVEAPAPSSPRLDRLRAELAVAELEDRLAAAKADDGKDPDEFRALKLELREARQALRENRED